MDLSLLILSFAVMCLPLYQARAVIHHTDLTWEETQSNETNFQRKKPSSEDYNSRAVNSNYHPYGLDTLGQGNIF